MRSRLQAWSARQAARYADPPAAAAATTGGDPLAIPAAAFDRHLLFVAPAARRMTRTEADAAIALAVADGRVLAVEHAGPPQALAVQLGVAVEDVAGDNRFGSVFQFAEYSGRPPRVLLYRHAMQTVTEAARAHGLPLPARAEDVYLAHELYHHLDQHRATPVSRLVRVRTFALGPASGVSSLAEVGACAFAAALTGLAYHPRLLDLLALRAIASAAAAAMEEALWRQV